MPAISFTQIKETCLYFYDLKQAEDFYGDVLGLPIISRMENKHVFFRAGRSVLLCFNPLDSGKKVSPPAHYAHGKYHFAFEVEPTDYEKAKAGIIRSNVVIIDKVIWQNGQESFYFNDPIGNVVEIVPKGIWD